MELARITGNLTAAARAHANQKLHLLRLSDQLDKQLWAMDKKRDKVIGFLHKLSNYPVLFEEAHIWDGKYCVNYGGSRLTEFGI